MADPFEVIIIGGGINGAGIARDLAMRGVSVLLLEQRDFGSGTTAYSTRLIHGGLRYLALLQFGLVYESLHERKTLLRIANHLVYPLPFYLPIYRGQKYGYWRVRLGLTLYDLLAGPDPLPNHHHLSREALLGSLPALSPQRLKAGFIYYDCQVPLPERLTLENILDAEAHGAVCLNYTQVTEIHPDGSGRFRVQAVDADTQQEHVFAAPVVINATGPWLNEIAHEFDPRAPRLVGGTKGSHILIHNRIGLQHAIYAPAKSDGRPFFIIPFSDHFLLIGTTDLFFEKKPEEAVATAAEVQYLIDESNRLFPELAITPEDILHTYSGVRPLPPQRGKAAGEISRKHAFYVHKIGGRKVRAFSVIGGKITTYRHLAEEAGDLALKMLGRPRLPCKTAEKLLPGAFTDESNHEDVAHMTFLQQSRKPLVLFGRRAEYIRRLAEQKDAWWQPMDSQVQEPVAQVVYCARHEKVRHLDDFLLRRSLWGFRRGRDEAFVRRVADVLAQELGWDDMQTNAEIERFQAYLDRAMQWKTELMRQD